MPRKPKRRGNLGRQTKSAKMKKASKKALQERLKKLSISRPYCTVCKRFQTKEEEINANIYENDDSDIEDFYMPAHNRGKLGTRWATTQEDTPVSGTEVLFKLFDILEMEFDVGHVCKDCYHLLEQLDSFQFQFACLKEKLMARIDQFWNRDIDYSTSGQAKADYELAVRAVDGKVASGEAVARKAVKSIKTLDNHEEMLNKVKIVSGPPLKGFTRSKVLVQVEKDNHRSNKIAKAQYGNWTDLKYVHQALKRGSFDKDFILNFNATDKDKGPMLFYREYVYQPHYAHSYMTSSFYSPDPIDKLVNRWKCTGGVDTQCQNILVTTKDNSSVMVESLFAKTPGTVDDYHLKNHRHGPVSNKFIFENFWGPEVADIVRNHPNQSPHGTLETCRLLMFNHDTTGNITSSDAAMLQLISLLKKELRDTVIKGESMEEVTLAWS